MQFFPNLFCIMLTACELGRNAISGPESFHILIYVSAHFLFKSSGRNMPCNFYTNVKEKQSSQYETDMCPYVLISDSSYFFYENASL